MPRVLVVDDAPIIRLALVSILKESECDVVGECSNGREAVEKYAELKPDVVTMDVIMPEMDGIEALEKILSNDQNAKVIMITAIDQRESLMRAIRIGAADYIVKPFEKDRIQSSIKKVLRLIKD